MQGGVCNQEGNTAKRCGVKEQSKKAVCALGLVLLDHTGAKCVEPLSNCGNKGLCPPGRQPGYSGKMKDAKRGNQRMQRSVCKPPVLLGVEPSSGLL